MGRQRVVVSDIRELTQKDILQWARNLRRFLAGLALIYITALIGLIQQEGHVITLADFIPNSFVLGAMTLYALNALQDLFNKWKGKVRYSNGTRTVTDF